MFDNPPSPARLWSRRFRRPRLWGGIVTALLAAFASLWFAARPALETRPPIVLAFASSMTGPLAPIGAEALATTRIYLDDVNSQGGIEGRPVVLQIFDDRSDPDVAAANARDILASPAVAGLGHASPSIAGAAAAEYRGGKLPAVAGLAPATELDKDNPWTFHTLSATATQAEFLAQYLRAVIEPRATIQRPPDIHVVTRDDPVGRGYRAGFARTGGDAMFDPLDPAETPEVAAQSLATHLARAPAPRIVVLGLEPEAARVALKAIRRAGVEATIVLASGAAAETFAQSFQNEPEERARPGFFTNGVYAIAPVIMDNVGLYGQGLATRFQARAGRQPGWFAAGAQDAARMLVTAIRDARIAGSGDPPQAAREKIRAALAAVDGPATAVTGISGMMFFDTGRNIPRPMRFGLFRDGHFVTAPLQLTQVRDLRQADVAREIEQGHMVKAGDEYFWLQRVVSTGIDLTRLSGLDIKTGTFHADFYFWIRYAQGDDLPSRIEFPAFAGTFDAARPLRSSTADGMEYRLWRVTGDFKAAFDLHDYPFDTQALVILMRNRDHPREQIAYAVDTFGLKLDGQGQFAGNPEVFRDLQQWRVLAMRSFTETFTIQSTLGNPSFFGTPSRTEYGALAVGIVVQRKALAFMAKALIPLFLLLLVVFATMFFPHSLSKERTTIPVTAILTSAVLLISMTNQLPPLGYTVILEYIFYLFFLLCLLTMVTGVLAEKLRDKEFHHHVIKVDRIGQVIYLGIIAVSVAWCFWRFGSAFAW